MSVLETITHSRRTSLVEWTVTGSSWNSDIYMHETEYQSRNDG
jgi:hypothetical protein